MICDITHVACRMSKTLAIHCTPVVYCGPGIWNTATPVGAICNYDAFSSFFIDTVERRTNTCTPVHEYSCTVYREYRVLEYNTWRLCYIALSTCISLWLCTVCIQVGSTYEEFTRKVFVYDSDKFSYLRFNLKSFNGQTFPGTIVLTGGRKTICE